MKHRHKRRWRKDIDRDNRRRILINRAGGRCEYCGEPTNLIEGDPHQATVDHFVPQSRGGTDELCNLRLACLSCNLSKGNKVDQ